MKMNNRQTDILFYKSEEEEFVSSAKHSISHKNRFNITNYNYDTVSAIDENEEKTVGYADF